MITSLKELFYSKRDEFDDFLLEEDEHPLSKTLRLTREVAKGQTHPDDLDNHENSIVNPHTLNHFQQEKEKTVNRVADKHGLSRHTYDDKAILNHHFNTLNPDRKHQTYRKPSMSSTKSR